MLEDDVKVVVVLGLVCVTVGVDEINVVLMLELFGIVAVVVEIVCDEEEPVDVDGMIIVLVVLD